jgi:hypothetical protein
MLGDRPEETTIRDPLQDIRNTRHVRIVVRNGVVHDARELLESAKGRIGPRDAADEVNW